MNGYWEGYSEVIEELLNDDVANKNDDIFVEELSDDGAGVVKFTGLNRPISIAPLKSKLPWLKNQKSSDGAFFDIVENQVVLHLVELKSNLSLKKWIHAKKQFRGMYVRARAVGFAIGRNNIDKVVCYVAYSRNELEEFKKSNPALLKQGLGISIDLEWNDYENGSVMLNNSTHAPLVAIIRDAVGNADYQLAS